MRKKIEALYFANYHRVRGEITGPGGIGCSCCTIGDRGKHKHFSERRIRSRSRVTPERMREAVTMYFNERAEAQ